MIKRFALYHFRIPCTSLIHPHGCTRVPEMTPCCAQVVCILCVSTAMKRCHCDKPEPHWKIKCPYCRTQCQCGVPAVSKTF